jgi:hypothetical protein
MSTDPGELLGRAEADALRGLAWPQYTNQYRSYYGLGKLLLVGSAQSAKKPYFHKTLVNSQYSPFDAV